MALIWSGESFISSPVFLPRMRFNSSNCTQSQLATVTMEIVTQEIVTKETTDTEGIPVFLEEKRKIGWTYWLDLKMKA